MRNFQWLVLAKDRNMALAVSMVIGILVLQAVMCTANAHELGAKSVDHLTSVCLSRQADGDLRLQVPHWHGGNPQPPAVVTWTLSSADGSRVSTGTFTGAYSSCGGQCPSLCTNTYSCGASQASQGAWFDTNVDPLNVFIPGETITYTVLGGEATTAPTGSCISVNGGYGVNGGTSGPIVVPPDTTTCVADICGDGFRVSTEQCDGSDLNGATCESLGFDGGSLACGPCCSYDTSSCLNCNDAASAPVLSGCLGGQVLSNDPGTCCASSSFTVTASDADTATLCPSPTAVQTGGNPPDSCFSNGDVVTWQATDSAGQTATCSWQYFVIDTEAPVFDSCPSSGVSVSAGGVIDYGPIVVSDNCGIPPTVTQTAGPSQGSVAGLPGDYTVTYVASDASLSSLDATCTFTLTVGSFDAVVYQLNITESDAEPHGPEEALFLYMYIPVRINYMGDYQGAFGNAAGDGSMEYFELRRSDTGVVHYTSEQRASGTDPSDTTQVFSGISRVMNRGDLELWICMNPSTGSSCALLYPEVNMCTSIFYNVPAGCELE